MAKFWLDPVRLQVTAGFRPPELRRMQQIVETHQAVFLEAWHDYFAG